MIASELPLRLQLSASRPLVPVEVAVFALDVPDADAVLLRVGGAPCVGQALEWAWDIATPGAERREVRIFWRCLLPGAPALSEAQVYNEVIPSHWGRVRGASIYRRWSCSQAHLGNLSAAGCVQAITAARTGPGGSAEYTRSSLITFLRRRRIV